jgi:hypothetical protein
MKAKQTIVIGPRRGLFDLGLRQLWKYRDLLLLFALRRLRLHHANSC